MAYDPKTGEWKAENTSVSRRVTGLMSQQSPMQQQARTQGAQASNRRGLLNTSMGAQAGQTAAYSAAVPIASQEAQQAQQSNMQGQQIRSQEQMKERQFGFEKQQQQRQLGSQERIARMNVAAHEREKAAGLAAAFENTYSQMVSNVMNNTEMPSSARDKYIQHAGKVRDSNLRLVEQMYNIKLDWSTPGVRASGTSSSSSSGTPSAGSSRTSRSTRRLRYDDQGGTRRRRHYGEGNNNN